ncbi:hypothetical protein E0I03_17605 [Dickeya dadantii]|uniref:hypothetical protein n=1 Tax=Dickeya dadantii TaxID=204038 RepID=UPI001495766C|nr:hypothetical protein [Dickeya dadantii]NPE52812.1 hypothetical protein [Dickeya dadantii]
MNRQQNDQVITLLDAFDALDFKGLVSEQYKDVGDISTIALGDIFVSDFVVMVGRIYNNFRQEFNDVNFSTLPFGYNYGNELGSGNLQSDLSNANSYISRKDFTSSLVHIYRLANYQRVNSFWESNTRRASRRAERKIQDENEILEAKKLIIEKRVSELDDFSKKSIDLEQRVNEFLEDSSTQVKNFESALQNIIVQSDNINNSYTNAINAVEKINSQLTLAESKKTDIEKLHDSSREELNEIRVNLSNYKNEYNDIYKKLEFLKISFEERLTFVEEKHAYFVERNNYLDDLIGREVGASLFETFKQRKNELSPSVTFWKWSVPILAIATVIWIFLLFHWSSDQQVEYKLLIVNSIKALPAIGLLLFGIAQYGKERNFQEEYAFKSAVALTLNSYAEQLINEENKDALILASVSSIYKSPIFHSKIKIEDGKSAVDSLSELLSKIKETSISKKSD